jgi:hypothetical protein
VGRFGMLSFNAMNSSGLKKGRGLRRMPFTIEKMARVAAADSDCQRIRGGLSFLQREFDSLAIGQPVPP